MCSIRSPTCNPLTRESGNDAANEQINRRTGKTVSGQARSVAGRKASSHDGASEGGAGKELANASEWSLAPAPASHKRADLPDLGQWAKLMDADNRAVLILLLRSLPISNPRVWEQLELESSDSPLRSSTENRRTTMRVPSASVAMMCLMTF